MIVGILTFMSMIIFMLGWVEHVKKFYKPGDWYNPALEILVQIVPVSSEGSSKPAYQSSLAKVVTARTHNQDIDEGSGQTLGLILQLGPVL